jgi:hypothetical protein
MDSTGGSFFGKKASLARGGSISSFRSLGILQLEHPEHRSLLGDSFIHSARASLSGLPAFDFDYAAKKSDTLIQWNQNIAFILQVCFA